MTREEIIRMARVACSFVPNEPMSPIAYVFTEVQLKRFHDMVVSSYNQTTRMHVATEREACAKLCEEIGRDMLRGGRLQAGVVSRRVADGIRRRGKL